PITSQPDVNAGSPNNPPRPRGPNAALESHLTALVQKTGTLKDMDAQDAGLRAALKLYVENRFDECRDALKSLRGTHPSLPPARYVLADILSDHNRLALAKVELERLAIEEPDFAGPFVMFGSLAAIERRFSDADLNFQHANRLLANSGDSPLEKSLRHRTVIGLASVAEMRRDWSRAREHMAVWLTIEPDNAVLKQRLARASLLDGREEECLRLLREVALKDPNIPPAEGLLASFYIEQDDEPGAAKWIRQALSLHPKDSRVHGIAAKWKLRAADFAKAEEFARAALKLNAKSLEARSVLGAVDWNRGKFSEAQQHFEAVHWGTGSGARTSIRLIQALVEQDDPAARSRAEALAKKNLERSPKSPSGHAMLAWIFHRQGRDQEAEAVMRKAISLGSLDASSGYYCACIFVKTGKSPEA
ncbi:MAG: hypothetical protein N2C14_21615, partial [Planctomycetales bacterium]